MKIQGFLGWNGKYPLWLTNWCIGRKCAGAAWCFRSRFVSGLVSGGPFPGDSQMRRGWNCAKRTPWYMIPLISILTTRELSNSERPSPEEDEIELATLRKQRKETTSRGRKKREPSFFFFCLLATLTAQQVAALNAFNIIGTKKDIFGSSLRHYPLLFRVFFRAMMISRMVWWRWPRPHRAPSGRGWHPFAPPPLIRFDIERRRHWRPAVATRGNKK